MLPAADVITPDDVFDELEADVKAADAILWVGISFQQSASTAYFRRVRRYLQARLLNSPLTIPKPLKASKDSIVCNQIAQCMLLARP